MKDWNWDVVAIWAAAIVFITVFWVGVALLLKARFG